MKKSKNRGSPQLARSPRSSRRDNKNKDSMFKNLRNGDRWNDVKLTNASVKENRVGCADEKQQYSGIRLQNITNKFEFLDDDITGDVIDNLEELATETAIADTTTSLHSHSLLSSKGAHRFKRQKSPPILQPVRKSLRIRNISVEGLELPEKEKEKTIYDIQSEEQKVYIPSGPVTMSEVYMLGGPLSKMKRKLVTSVELNEEDIENDQQQFLQTKKENTEICDLICKLQRDEPSQHPFDSSLNTFTRLGITADTVAKVVRSRGTSLAFHPASEKVLIAAGDKGGMIGLWDVTSTNVDNGGIYIYEPHNGSINALRFGVFDSHKLYSCSYDGTVRSADFETGIFDEVYRVDNHGTLCKYFDFNDPNTLLVALDDGSVQLVDVRLPGKAQHYFQLHAKSVMSVSCHPTSPTYVATSSADGTAKIWDIKAAGMQRNTSTKAVVCSVASPIYTVHHGKSVETAQFSKVTGRNLVTIGFDNTIRIHDCARIDSGNIKQKAVVHHNNHTGRWLTKFRPSWHPSSDDLFLVGSMKYPRRVELFSDEGCLMHSFTGDMDVINSVCSLNEFHPHLPCVAGINSSGRVNVWK